MKSDADLLRQYAETRDEVCFAELVRRHIRFVHAVSLRRLRDGHAAQDATQAVFVALARKAGAVASAPSLIGWLHRSAVYETRNVMRSQTHRLLRETEAHRLGTICSDVSPNDAAMASVLDDVLSELPAGDREIILERYFAERSFAEMGTTLRISESGARMRVERALEKLRAKLARRGITSTATILAGALPKFCSAAVPSGMVREVVKTAVSAGARGAGVASWIGFMSTGKMVTGAAFIAAIAGLGYQYRLSQALEGQLNASRADIAAANKQLHVVESQLSELRQQQSFVKPVVASAAAGETGAGAAPATAAAPISGVTPKLPKGWFQNGSANELYEVGVDANNVWGGMPSAYAKSIGPADKKFGGMMQTISAQQYEGQRVRLSGWVKTEDANDGGGHLWLRVDGPEPGKTLQFDNMDGRQPKGTTDWQEYSIVLDVPAQATRLNYGFFVGGKGTMWVNGLTITQVDSNVPTTNMLKPPPLLPETPVNLGFAAPAPTN